MLHYDKNHFKGFNFKKKINLKFFSENICIIPLIHFTFSNDFKTH